MRHIVSKQNWGTIDLDTQSGVILVREDWLYTWKVDAPRVHSWTYQEKRSFHKRLDREIWGAWSGHFSITVTGRSAFAIAFAGRVLKTDFDIRWVLHGGNWQADVVKLAPGWQPGVRRPWVNFAALKIMLYTSMFAPYTAQNDARVLRPGFQAGPHEFGHTINNPDEYGRLSPNLGDTDSLMNIGHQLRTRHAHLIIETLNTMIPETEFHV
jgi:hypothetical protein